LAGRARKHGRRTGPVDGPHRSSRAAAPADLPPAEARKVRRGTGPSRAHRNDAAVPAAPAATPPAEQVGRAGQAPRTSTAEERLAFLASASRVLGETLDLDVTLRALARLPIPVLADQCVVDVVGDDGSIRRAAVAARTPELEAHLRLLQERFRSTALAQHALKQGRGVLVPALAEADLDRAAPDPEHRAAVARFAGWSMVVAPLLHGGEGLGALMVGRPDAPYTPEDVALVEDLASRAAAAVANARLLQRERQAREALERRDEVLRLITDYGGDLFSVLDDQGRYVHASPSFRRVLGLDPEALRGRNVLDLLHPDDVPAAVQELAKVASGGVDGRATLRVRHADGSWRWVEAGGTLVRDDEGNPRIVSISRDVTERRAAEERLERYRAIVERSNDGIAIVDPQGRYLEQNEAHRALIGYPDEALRSKTPAIHMGEATFAEVVRALQAEGRFRGEVTSTRADGSMLPIELSAFTLRDARGEVVGHVGIKRDIAARKLAEAEQHRRLAQLQELYRLSVAAGRADADQPVLEAALDAVRGALGVEKAAVLLFDAAGTMRFRAWRGLSQQYRAAVEGHSPWAPCDPDPRPVLVGDARSDPSLAGYRALLEGEGIGALAFVPLVDQGRLLGKMMVYRDTPRPWGQDEVHLAQTVAGHVAAAVARRAAAEALARQHGLLEAVVQGTSDPIWVKDTAGRYVLLNGPGATMAGLSPERRSEAVGRTAEEFFPPEAAKLIASRDRAVIEGGETLSTEDTLLAAGRPRTFLVSRSPLRDATGAVTGLLGIARDITDRRAAEEALRASEERYRGLVQSIPGAVYRSEFEPPWRFEHVGPAVEAICGHAPEAFTAGGLTWDSLVDPADAPRIDAAVAQAVEGGGVFDLEYRIRRRDGTTAWVHDIARIVRRGSQAWFEGVLLDVTGRRVAEEALRAREARLLRQNAVLLGLANARPTDPADLASALVRITEAAAATLEVDRASVWLYDQARTSIVCADLFRRPEGAHEAGLELSARDFPHYFEAMAQERTIAAADAQADPRTREFASSYLQPLGIGAMLDAPIRLGGHVVGVVCHEHVGPPRAWTPEEEQFAATIADFVAVALAEAERGRAEDALRMQGHVLESMGEGVCLCDEDGTILYTNPAEDRMFGYAAGELVGQHVTVQNAYPPEENERLVQEVFDTLRQEGSWHGEWHNRRKDGTTFWTEARITGITLGGKRCWVCVQSDVTDRKRAREEREGLLRDLQVEQARQRAIVAQMPAGIIIVDPEGKVLLANEAASHLVGRPIPIGGGPEGYPTHGARDATGEAVPLERLPALRALRGEVVTGELLQVRRADGKDAWLRVNAGPVLDREGRVVAAVGMYTDVTVERAAAEERERVLEALALEQARLKALVEQMPAAVIIAEAPRGKLLFANEQVERTWRMPFVASQDVQEYRAYKGFHADGRPYEPEEWPLARAITRGEVVVGEELEFERGDGTRGWMRCNAAPIRDATGRIVAGVVVFDDITEARATQAALADQHHLVSSITDNATSALFLLDADGTLDYVNPAAEAMFGVALEEVRGRKAHDVVHWKKPDGSPYPMDECPIDRAYASLEAMQHHEDLFVRSDGTFVPVSCSVSPLQRDGVVQGAVVEVRDLSERERVMRALQEANDRLQELDRLKTQFLNTVAHELRTPLTPITLQLEIVKHALAGDEKQRRNLAILDRNMQRLSVLIEDILDVARLQSGRLTLHLTEVDLDKLVAEVGETFQEPARRAGIALEVRLGAVGKVKADTHRVGQVLFNLLSNAMKFTPTGGRIGVATERRGGEVEVEVRDSGAGLEPHQLAKLFRPFSQVHDTTTKATAGTGLGLYISRGIVEQHGGTIGARSEGAGKGATFTFTLPEGGPPARLATFQASPGGTPPEGTAE
jgi:PAS domain S-box-containing protein